MPLQLLKPTLAPLTLRLGLAVILFYHGLLKILFHGGTDWSPDLGIPPAVQVTIAWLEFLSGLALALGAGTRVAALVVAVMQIGAILLVTGERDFISMSRLARGGAHGYRFAAVGWEYNFALLIMCLTLILLGGGTWSLNNLFLQWLAKRKDASATPAPLISAASPAASAADPTGPR